MGASFEDWHHDALAGPGDHRQASHRPLVKQGERDLHPELTRADLRALAGNLHDTFFGEHPDNVVFFNLVKCLLAKIHDERSCRPGAAYAFQVFRRGSETEPAVAVFGRVNRLYREACERYLEPDTDGSDEIRAREFSEDRVKTVVQVLQGISITQGAARNSDIMGAFFEEILRTGFRQDRGMYFTHDNLVRFMLEAVDLPGLTRQLWCDAPSTTRRLPRVIDPACGSGTFLLHAKRAVAAALSAAGKDELDGRRRTPEARQGGDPGGFLHGFDPKFVMAITAKVNMVLHGGGGAKILERDAFAPLPDHPQAKLLLGRTSDEQRAVPRARYAPDTCESFDLVVSNPPFNVKLARETREQLCTSFVLSDKTPSEGLFLERCFQLLAPNGRLALVLPESVLNAKELTEVRLFLYRFFQIKGIVSLPRNLFEDTPTLTSLLFARKKTAREIERWDERWEEVEASARRRLQLAKRVLGKECSGTHTARQVHAKVVEALRPTIPADAWVVKGGRNADVLRLSPSWTNESGTEAAAHYRAMFRLSGFERLLRAQVFRAVAEDLDYSYPAYEVDEVGYKLSSRRERARPNQLCLFEGRATGRSWTNLHLANEPCDVVIDLRDPKTVLDMFRNAVQWERP